MAVQPVKNALELSLWRLCTEQIAFTGADWEVKGLGVMSDHLSTSGLDSYLCKLFNGLN